MTTCYACNASCYAFVTPRISSSTGCYACYASFFLGSHIRKNETTLGSRKRPLRETPTLPRKCVTSVTTRPPHKNAPFGRVTKHAPTRNKADRRTA